MSSSLELGMQVLKPLWPQHVWAASDAQYEEGTIGLGTSRTVRQEGLSIQNEVGM